MRQTPAHQSATADAGSPVLTTGDHHASSSYHPAQRALHQPGLEYRDHLNTNLADTFAKARERLAAQAAIEEATPKPQRKRPALMQVRRVRAGTTNHLTLPLF